MLGRCLALSPSRSLVATGQMGKFPKVFVWNPVSSPDPNDSPFKEPARRILHKDMPGIYCMEALPPARLVDRRVRRLYSGFLVSVIAPRSCVGMLPRPGAYVNNQICGG